MTMIKRKVSVKPETLVRFQCLEMALERYQNGGGSLRAIKQTADVFYSLVESDPLMRLRCLELALQREKTDSHNLSIKAYESLLRQVVDDFYSFVTPLYVDTKE